MKPCNQCGKCCIKYGDGGLVATSEEIAWWETHRPHIARYVRANQIWMDPESGEQLKRCPWLEVSADGKLYSCAIYLDRPADCRHYPVNVSQMVVDECEMLEVRDLLDTDRAQQKLDRMMIDSRPAG